MTGNLDNSESLVLLIGTIESEGIRSSLKTSGQQYKIKRLESKPENWNSINSYFEEFAVACVVLKLTGSVYGLFVHPQYEGARDTLIEHLAQVPHVIFIHEEVITEETFKDLEKTTKEDDNWFSTAYFHQPEKEVKDAVNNLLKSKDLNVLSYKSNAEMTVMASSFIEEAREGLLFRIYVPSGRIWANETDRLIQLFQDYLSKLKNLAVRLSQRRTGKGIVYEFFKVPDSSAQYSNDQEELAIQFQEFSHFLGLAVSNPHEAEEFLRSINVDTNQVLPVLTRYAKEAKRLQIDIKHEREQKVLAIRHRLESELVDVIPTGTSLEALSQLADLALPTPSFFGAAIGGNSQILQIAASSGASITLNNNPQIVRAVNSVVAQEIEGEVHLGVEDKEIIRLIQEYGSNRKTELMSAVHELADTSAPQNDRLVSKQKLKAFLARLGQAASDIGVNLLQAYLEKAMGLK